MSAYGGGRGPGAMLRGTLRQVAVSSGFPLSGLFLAVTAAGLFFLTALAVIGIWVAFS